MVVIKEPVNFDWDKGNIGKNGKLSVGEKEAEEVFFDKKRVIFNDPPHSTIEERYIVLGKTKRKRLLFVVFTQRNGDKKVRIISARDINKKEVKLYEKKA